MEGRMGLGMGRGGKGFGDRGVLGEEGEGRRGLGMGVCSGGGVDGTDIKVQADTMFSAMLQVMRVNRARCSSQRFELPVEFVKRARHSLRRVSQCRAVLVFRASWSSP